MLGFTEPGKTLSPEERKFAVDYMEQTRKGLLMDIKGLSEQQLNFKPSPQKWSIAQCVEHIAIAEIALMKILQESLDQPADPSKRAEITASDTTVLRVVTDRSHKSTAKEFLQPDDKFADYNAALQGFIDRRNKNISYIISTQDDLRNHFCSHAIMGRIDGFQYLLLISAHCKRHTLQIEEVMADPNFPGPKKRSPTAGL